MSVGGAARSPRTGDFLIAFALPEPQQRPEREARRTVLAVATKRLREGPWPDAASTPDAPMHR